MIPTLVITRYLVEDRERFKSLPGVTNQFTPTKLVASLQGNVSSV